MIKHHRSPMYNWNFNNENGEFIRWGENQLIDPAYSTIGPEILDIEVSTICNGPGIPCSFCYKGNTPVGLYMTHERFLKVLDKIPNNLTQIAFGIGDPDSNPDLEKIFKTTRNRGIIPNITINGYRMNAYFYDMLVNYCGSIAVSHYNDDQCFDTVFELTDRGASQVNIHQVFHDTTFDKCINLINKVSKDKRLINLNALLFLMLKPKGRAIGTELIKNSDKFNEVIDNSLKLNVNIGFDSCSAPVLLKQFENKEELQTIKTLIEPCEAFLFSAYANVLGEFFPCSFCEGEPGWESGFLITETTDFIKDIWNHERTINWRNSLLNSSKNCKCSLNDYCRNCPMFKITPCKE